jgi:hypothetical protein
MKAPLGMRFTFTFSITWAVDGVDCQRHPPAVLPQEKIRYLLYKRLGESQGLSPRVRKILPREGFDPRTVQPVA